MFQLASLSLYFHSIVSVESSLWSENQTEVHLGVHFEGLTDPNHAQVTTEYTLDEYDRQGDVKNCGPSPSSATLDLGGLGKLLNLSKPEHTTS